MHKHPNVGRKPEKPEEGTERMGVRSLRRMKIGGRRRKQKERSGKVRHDLQGKFRACTFNSFSASCQRGLRFFLCNYLTNLES